jgi:uncharacterized membrane protein YgcG
MFSSRLIFFARTILISAVYGCSFCLVPSHAQSTSDTAALFRIIPRAQVESLIRKQLRPILEAKNIEPITIDARFSVFIPTIADSLVSFFKYHPDIERITNGDSLLMKKLKSTAGQQKWEKNILEMNAKLVDNAAMLWPMLLSRDYSDRILVFHSDIKVLPSSKLLVEETIVLYNGNGEKSPDIDYNMTSDPNDDIKRGIVRDFPTRYLGKNGFWETTGFELLSVTKNGEKSNYHTENLDNGIRVMVGDAEVNLSTGIYTYQLLYQTDRQIIFHPEKDELYWNVNGTGWVFYADSVSGTIHFPWSARISENACYTGAQGSTDRFCASILLNDSTIHFKNTARFDPYQGLTIAASIQKGILTPPPPKGLVQMAKDNFGVAILGAVFAILLFFYGIIWFFKGRDPKKGTIYPQFEPPAGLSAADAGYIHQQKFGTHLFAAALVDMAVRKELKIEVETRKMLFKYKVYKFEKPAEQGMEAPGVFEQQYGFLPSSLYGQEAQSGKYNPQFKSCHDKLKTNLEERFKMRGRKKNTYHGMFVRNDGVTGCGAILAFLACGFAVIYIINTYTPQILLTGGLLAVAILALHILFVRLMPAYSQKGRATTDHIEGFKMYLQTAEQRLYEQLTPPNKTLDLFEKYLPYAIALKVENEWAEKFDNLMQTALEQGYQPAYYHGTGSFSRSFSMAEMSRGISSGLTSTVASASTPPSSSSGGSSGGGSSGGGGGGGGGGGW